VLQNFAVFVTNVVNCMLFLFFDRKKTAVLT